MRDNIFNTKHFTKTENNDIYCELFQPISNNAILGCQQKYASKWKME